MTKFLILLTLCFSSMSFACDGEDFAHFHNRMYRTAIEQNIIFAEKCLFEEDYKTANEYYVTAHEQYKMLTFPDEKLEIRINVGIFVSESMIAN